MIDTVSLNRIFLHVARQAAELESREAITGLPDEVLDEIKSLSLDDIERLARTCKTCMISVRVDAEQIRAIKRMAEDEAKAYSLMRAVSGSK